jgi:cell division protease FtsH
MQSKIDQEVREIIDQCYKNSQKILKQNKEKLDQVAEALLSRETLEGEQFEAIMSERKGSRSIRQKKDVEKKTKRAKTTGQA